MLRVLLPALLLGFSLSLSPPAAEAASKCTGSQCQKASKSQKAQKAEKPQKAKTKKVKKQQASRGKGRSGYTAEQRRQLMERARQVCRKEFGASSTVYSVDYKKLRVMCMPPGS